MLTAARSNRAPERREGAGWDWTSSVISAVPRPLARPFILVLFFMVAAMPSAAQDGSAAKIDAYVRAEMARRHIPGLALLVARDHRVILAANYGVANLELGAPVADGTSFEIASMTKQFTDAA